MSYLVMPQQVASWLLEKPEVRDALATSIQSGELQDFVRQAEFVAGPARILSESTGNLLFFEHSDYRSGTGYDPLGFIRISEPFSITDGGLPAASLERAIFTINQRLLNRIFPGKFFFRRLDEDRYKIEAPRGPYGTPAHLGWIERSIAVGQSYVRCVLLCGPGHDWDEVSRSALAAGASLDIMVESLRNIQRSPVRRTPVSSETLLRLQSKIQPKSASPSLSLTVRARSPYSQPADAYRTNSWSYDEWLGIASPLSHDQRAILETQPFVSHPLRIVGPAGSGKTLLMQLVAMTILRDKSGTRILYVTHNDAMEQRVQQRFLILGAENSITSGSLHITTLSRYAMELQNLRTTALLEDDPEKAKDAAYGLLREAVTAALAEHESLISTSRALEALTRNDTARRYLDEFIRAEISASIKGRGLTYDRGSYTDTEDALSTFHGSLTPDERGFIYSVFERYQLTLEAYDVLDSDDVAVSMLAKVRAPAWNLDRKKFGFDYVFVDEAQLFSDNERQVFPLLTKQRSPYTPVVIALDEAQRLFAPPAKGLALLGLSDVARGTLVVAHRLSEHVARLAFFVISESTMIFDDDFPEFQSQQLSQHESSGSDEATPDFIEVSRDVIFRAANRRIRLWRSIGLKQFAIIAHTEATYAHLVKELPTLMRDLDLRIVSKRAEGDYVDHPFVALSRPEFIGGQEFDGVICCSLEDGLVPPRVPENMILESSLEQQTLREIYVCFTRARDRLAVINAANSNPSPVIERAIVRGLLKSSSSDSS